ncbi:MAG: type VI secretion system tip protein VgrG, partial [Bacteroidota bacterium]
MANNRTIPVNAQGAVVTFTLKINGDKIPQTVQVLRLSVQKEINKISLAKVVVLDGDAASEDFPVSNEELFVPGNMLEIFAGHQSEEDLIFKGEIVKHGIQIRQNGTTLLKVEARDIAYKLTLAYKNRYFQEQTDSEVIEDILGEYEIDHELTDTSVTHPELVQYETRDWDFILSRADVNGRFCLVDDGVFNLIQPDFDQESNLTLQFGATILEFDAEIDSRMQYKMIKTQSWDASTQELIEAEAAEPAIEEQGNLSSSELAETNSLEEFILHHNGNLQANELQSWADAKLQKSRLAKIRGRVRLEGYAGAKPGNILTLSGVGDRFNGKVFVSGVRHYLAEGEWETDFQFGVEPQWFAADRPVHAPLNSGLAPGIQGLHIGVVKQIHDDPAGAFRVLVNIPLIDPDEEGSWCRVASLDAGENRGFFFRPDVGDEVILGFLNN